MLARETIFKIARNRPCGLSTTRSPFFAAASKNRSTVGNLKFRVTTDPKKRGFFRFAPFSLFSLISPFSCPFSLISYSYSPFTIIPFGRRAHPWNRFRMATFPERVPSLFHEDSNPSDKIAFCAPLLYIRFAVNVTVTGEIHMIPIQIWPVFGEAAGP